MDPSNPLRSIAPTVDADVLYTLARTNAPLTGYVIEKATGRAHARVLKILARLVEEGLVEGEQVGRATRYKLNPQHVLARPLIEAAGSMAVLESQIADGARKMEPAPIAVLLFGSFARRDGTAESDVDLFLVRPEWVDPGDAAWIRSRSELARAAETASGNPCQLVEATALELSEGAALGEALVDALRAEAVCLFGKAPEALRSPPLARPAR